MSKQPLKYLKNEVIEDLTARRIREYEAKAGVTVKLPVPVEKIVEQVLGLDFEWDEIEEQPGEQILAGLVAAERKIVLNEKHLALFQSKPGLERSTIGHEAGHWDVDIDRASLNHPTFPGFEVQLHIVKRHSRKADRLIEVLFSRAMHDERAYQFYKKLTEGQDTPEVRSAVDRYQSALLMPAWLIREAGQRYDLTKWPQLYRLAEEAQVNITNLAVRLQRLGLIYKIGKNKQICVTEEEATGQRSLF